jgi:hypothetical protein
MKSTVDSNTIKNNGVYQTKETNKSKAKNISTCKEKKIIKNMSKTKE